MQYCAYCGNEVETVSNAQCPRCGNPGNGSPRLSDDANFTNPVMKWLLAIVVVGLLAGYVINIMFFVAFPRIISAVLRSRQKSTMANIRTLAKAVEAYAADNHDYPRGASASALRAQLEPEYSRAIPTKDGWRDELQYTCLQNAASQQSGKCSGYVIVSAGNDGRFEIDPMPETFVAPKPRATTNFDCDIVYTGGKFVEYPAGLQ